MSKPYPDDIKYTLQQEIEEHTWEDVSLETYKYLADAKVRMDLFQKRNPHLYFRIIRRAYHIEENAALYGTKPETKPTDVNPNSYSMFDND